MNVNEWIEVDSDVMRGKPVIKATRIPVELIVRKLGEGATIKDLIDGYPNLSKQAIHAALLYAADTVADEQFIYLKTGTAN
jgi:uncharacterized protein (DUF433 family)